MLDNYKAVFWVPRQHCKTIVCLLRSLHRAAQVLLTPTLILRGGALQWDANRYIAMNPPPRPHLSLKKQSRWSVCALPQDLCPDKVFTGLLALTPMPALPALFADELSTSQLEISSKPSSLSSWFSYLGKQRPFSSMHKSLGSIPQHSKNQVLLEAEAGRSQVQGHPCYTLRTSLCSSTVGFPEKWPICLS